MKKENIFCDSCGQEVYSTEKSGHSYWVIHHEYYCGSPNCAVYHPPTIDAIWCDKCFKENTENEYNKKELEK